MVSIMVLTLFNWMIGGNSLLWYWAKFVQSGALILERPELANCGDELIPPAEVCACQG